MDSSLEVITIFMKIKHLEVCERTVKVLCGDRLSYGGYC